MPSRQYIGYILRTVHDYNYSTSTSTGTGRTFLTLLIFDVTTGLPAPPGLGLITRNRGTHLREPAQKSF